MPKVFNASEIMQFAIRIEENGQTFYKLMAEKLKDKKIKELFEYLAQQELIHRQIFKKMADELETYEPAQSFPVEYFQYLRAYADEHIFTKAKTGKIMADRIKSAEEALDFALSAELDSILYYLEAKNLVADYEKSKLDQVVEEERRHYMQLLQIKKKI